MINNQKFFMHFDDCQNNETNKNIVKFSIVVAWTTTVLFYQKTRLFQISTFIFFTTQLSFS